MEENYNVQIFNNDEFGHIRTVMINKEPWFIGKDIAFSLGYKRSAKAIRDNVDPSDIDEVLTQDTIGRNQSTIIINESGLYSLIMSSKLKSDSVKHFKHWVTHDVLPELRKTGAYFVPGREQEAIQMLFPELSEDTKLKMVLDLRKKNQELKDKAESLQLSNKALAHGILEWEDRKKLNAAMRRLAGKSRHYTGTLYNQFYRQLLYKHGIMIRARGKAPYLQYIKEDEWDKVIQTFSAMCESYNVSAAEMFDEIEVC